MGTEIHMKEQEKIAGSGIIEGEIVMSQEIGEIAAALAIAQGEIESASKLSDNPFYNSKYADLAEVWNTARGPLSKNALSVVQLTQGGPVLITIITILSHSSGQFFRSDLTVKPVAKVDKKTGELREISPQDLGSAITYGRRYALAAICGIAQQDDDGNSASDKGKAPEAKSQQPERKSETAPVAPEPPADAPAKGKAGVISEPQRKRLYAIANKREKETGIAAKDLCQEAMETECDPIPEKTTGILRSDYEAVVAFVEACDVDTFGVPQ